MDDLVSIIIPTYNRAHLIGETLDSVIAQTYTNWECIIVDDGSTDKTKQLINRDYQEVSRIKFYERPVNRKKGANACRNYGFELSKGSRVLWFDSDDLMEPDYLKTALELLNSKQDRIDVVVSNYKIFSNTSNEIIHVQRNVIKDLSLDYFTGKINFGSWALIWKRSIVVNFYFDENLNRAQELDFHYKIFSSKKVNWRMIQKPMVLVRRHVRSITGDYNKGCVKSILSELIVRRKILYYLQKSSISQNRLKEALNIYLNGFRNLAVHGNMDQLNEEVRLLRRTLNFNEKFILWWIKLNFLTLITKKGRGSYRLKSHIFDLEKFLK